MNNKFIFVTAYIELNKELTDGYFERFKKLASLGYDMKVYIDIRCINKIDELKEYKNLDIELIRWDELPINEIIEDKKLRLPWTDNPSKDTLEYMIVQNSKIFFLYKTKTEKETLIWIDFGILKITDDLDHFKKNFDNLKTYDKIVIAGGILERKFLDFDHGIYWRFLGGLVICPKHLIFDFYASCMGEILRYVNSGWMTWEVNIWSNLEFKKTYLKHYQADHNKSMFEFINIVDNCPNCNSENVRYMFDEKQNRKNKYDYDVVVACYACNRCGFKIDKIKEMKQNVKFNI